MGLAENGSWEREFVTTLHDRASWQRYDSAVFDVTDF
jgi:hypothetical protein